MKMSKKFRAIASAALISAMVMSMSGMSALAAATNTSTAGDANAATINKYLVMDQNANVPNATFSYTIVAGTAIAASGNRPEVKAGIEANNIVISSTEFKAGDTTYTVGEGVVAGLSANQKFAKNTATVDFSNVTFTEPGIYRYVITEKAITGEQGITKDDNSLYLDAYVTSDDDGSLTVSRYILHKSDSILDKNQQEYSVDEKTTGFVNHYDTKDLSLEKQVTGNQGDRSKKFSFTVEISDADPQTKYTVAASMSEALPVADRILTTDDNGAVSKTFELRDDESVIIYGLTAETKYSITETDYSALGYETTNNKGDGLTTGEQTMGTENNSVVFTNNKDVTTPTGIIMSFAPYILVLALSGVFAVMFLRKKREDF